MLVVLDSFSAFPSTRILSICLVLRICVMNNTLIGKTMTKVEITIQDGKVTWVEQTGDQLPQELWNDFNVAIRSAVERYLND